MKKILVVDDDNINRKLLNVLLKKTGKYEVIEAENGMEALNIIKNESIDMVLLDIIMPVMDGIDLLKILKSDENFKSIPIIILTTDDTKKNEAEILGASDFITKPVSPVQLLDKIGEYI